MEKPGSVSVPKTQPLGSPVHKGVAFAVPVPAAPPSDDELELPEEHAAAYAATTHANIFHERSAFRIEP
jgi:hypothetical protein